MNKHNFLFPLVFSILFISSISSSAQTGLEEVTVTGTYIKHSDTYNSSSPITALSSDDISAQGADSLAEIALDLTINTGSEVRTNDILSPNISGTSSLNLRGLGLGATLTLFNSRRMTLSSVSSLDGSQFVDLNNIPLNVIDRLEIVKDGASAIYGSDAVAGVANIITRDVDGLEVDLRYQETTADGQDDKSANIAWGKAWDSGKVNMFYTYFDRNPLHARDKEFTFDSFITPLGFPGNFLPLGAAGPVGPPLADPDCLNAGPDYPADNFIEPFSGFCNTNSTNDKNFIHLIAKEERHLVYLDGDYKLTDSLKLKGEYNYAGTNVTRARGSSLPLLIPGAAPFIPASHPDFPAAFNAFPGITGVVPILISPVPNGTNDAAHTFDYDTHRVMIGADYEITPDWSADMSIVYSRTNSFDSIPAVTTSELQSAVFGFGGDNCNPAIDAPGTGSCEFYNIFGSAIVAPSAANYSPNSATVLDFITGARETDKTSEILSVEGIFSGSLFELNGRPVGAVAGVQYRWDSLKARFNDDYTSGNFTFHPRSQNFDGTRDSYSVFGELAIPLFDEFDVSLALRYEDYGADGGDTIDPKVGFGWQLHENMLLRGSYGTSFRAPTPLHLRGFDSTAQGAQNICGSTQNGAIAKFIQPNANLSPEDSTSITVGAVFTPFSTMDISVDYWNYDYQDILGIDSVQGVINAACGANPLDPGSVDSRITSAGSVVQQVALDFQNLGTIKTDGFDVSGRYIIDSSQGTWTIANTATYINKYDLKSGTGNVIDGLGQRNNNNFGRATPQWRNNSSLQWVKNNHSASFSIKYIDSYIDDTDNTTIDSVVTLDLQYSYIFKNWGEGTKVTIGINNLLDDDPPRAAGILGYDTYVHDPRGRIGYVWLKTNLSGFFEK